MGLSTTTARVSYAGDGSTVAFAFAYKYIASANLRVFLYDTTDDTTEEQTLNSDYTIAPTSAATNGVYPGATITFSTAPGSDKKVVIFRDPALTQEFDFDAESDPLPVITRSADNDAMRYQSINDLKGRSLRLPDGDYQTWDSSYTKEQWANNALMFDADGDPMPGSLFDSAIAVTASWAAWLIQPLTDVISTAMQPVLAAASLASARAKLSVGEVFLPENYNAAGDGVTNDTTAINNCIAAAAAAGVHAKVYLTSTYLISSASALSNVYGVESIGPGRIIVAVTGGHQQITSYADNGNRLSIGKEYLSRAYEFLATSQVSGTYTLNCFLYGDSTVEGGHGESVGVEDALQYFATMHGVPNCTFTNRGVGGSTVDEMNAISDLGSTTGLIFIKYGINDAADGVPTFATNLRAALAAIRADSDGGEGSLSIILVGPNSTNDSPNDRDEEWYEQLRGIYVEAARDYKCAFFDTYAYLRDSRSAAGKWLDDPYSDGRGVHPQGNANLWIWGKVWTEFFSDEDVAPYKTNKVINHGAVSETLTASTVPSAFAHAALHNSRATIANGFPFEGGLATIRNADAPAVQILFPYAQYNTRIAIRTAYVSGDSWNRWSGVKEDLTLGYNSWVDAALGAGFPAPGAFVDATGVVHLVGGIKSGTTTAGTQVAQLPSGMAPAYNQIFPVCANGGIVQIKVQTNGGIYLQTTGDASFTMLDGISFLAA